MRGAAVAAAGRLPGLTQDASAGSRVSDTVLGLWIFACARMTLSKSQGHKITNSRDPVMGGGRVKTCASRERAALFSLWCFSDSDRQCFSFFGLTVSRRTFYAQFESWGFYTASAHCRPLGLLDFDRGLCPRLWKNASAEAGAALCFAGVRTETPVDRLTRAA